MIGMGRAEAKSVQAAKRPMAATSGASLPRDVFVLSIVADLEGRDLDGLRRQWRAHLGGEAPAHLPRWLLMRVLAYRRFRRSRQIDPAEPSLREERWRRRPLRQARPTDSAWRRTEGRRAARS